MPKLLRYFLYPHPVIVVLLVLFSAVSLIYSFGFTDGDTIISYISYAVSAYTMTVACVALPKLIKSVRSFKRQNKYIQIYNSSPQLRVTLSLYGTLLMNVIYAAMQLFSGFYYHSVWFYALSGYYAVLAIMRFFLLKDVRRESAGKNRYRELKLYRLCGWLLLEMTVTLSVITSYIVEQNRGFEYHYIYTIALAAYTFASTAVAIVNAVKYKKYNSPVMSAAKSISLVSAAVSMMSLETAMLSAFGEDNTPQFRQIMTASTGGAVCIFVLVLAIYMIVHSSKEIKKLNHERKS